MTLSFLTDTFSQFLFQMGRGKRWALRLSSPRCFTVEKAMMNPKLSNGGSMVHLLFTMEELEMNRESIYGLCNYKVSTSEALFLFVMGHRTAQLLILCDILEKSGAEVSHFRYIAEKGKFISFITT